MARGVVSLQPRVCKGEPAGASAAMTLHKRAFWLSSAALFRTFVFAPAEIPIRELKVVLELALRLDIICIDSKIKCVGHTCACTHTYTIHTRMHVLYMLIYVCMFLKTISIFMSFLVK